MKIKNKNKTNNKKDNVSRKDEDIDLNTQTFPASITFRCANFVSAHRSLLLCKSFLS